MTDSECSLIQNKLDSLKNIKIETALELLSIIIRHNSAIAVPREINTMLCEMKNHLNTQPVEEEKKKTRNCFTNWKINFTHLMYAAACRQQSSEQKFSSYYFYRA